MKRWAASQRGIRWTLGGIAAVGLAPAAARVLMPAGDWLAHHDVSPAREPLPQTARDAARGRLLTLGAGLLATGALVFTARRFVLSRDGQVTDRYTEAIEQLGSEKLDVRIGGIHALERVARGSARDHPAVMEMLAAFIREHSREPWPPPDPCGQVRERSLRPDVYAAITVVGRRLTERDIRPIDLTGADLTGADLTGADLGGARLTGANLTRANLTRADLTDADLADADLTCAELTRAELTGALWPIGGPVPEGWKRHTGSGQLITAGTDAETAEANQPHG
jgi:pentapeptide repeat protein